VGVVILLLVILAVFAIFGGLAWNPLLFLLLAVVLIVLLARAP
jgi:hypothetical protein